MKTNKFLLLKISIVVAMLLVGFLLYDKLPDQMPTHWNYLGQADNYGSKLFGVLMLPILNIIFLILFPILPKISPKEQMENLKNKSWEMMQISIMGFMAYIYFVSLYITLNPQISINRFMFIGLGILFALIGNYLGKIRQNYFVGIKVPWTLQNEEVRNKTNRLGGWTFVIGGLLFVLAGILDLQGIIIVWLLVIIILGVSLLPMGYSLYLYKKLEKSN